MAGFFLNLQILYEQLKIRGILCRLSLESDTLCLKGARFYMGASGVSEEYVYVTDADTLTKNPFAKKQGALIVMEADEKVSELPERCSCIYVSPGQNIHMVFNEIQQIFAYYEGLERRVNEILNSDGSLKDLVALAAEHFQKSIFYHDEFYHILAYSNYSAIAPYVSYNERKSTYVQDAELINQFRTSPSYMETLGTRGGHLWESDYDETRAVYANVWVNDAYKGRLVLQSDGMEYTRGQIYEISFC